MRCLVTGAAGFIGSHLVESLLADGAEVVGIDAFVDNYAAERKRAHLSAIPESAEFRLLEDSLQRIDLIGVLEGVDRVYHLAALPGVRASWGRSFADYVVNNVLATQCLLEACKEVGVQRVIYASSSSVYGDVDVLPMNEEARERPFSPYGVTKLAAEHLARLYHRNDGLATVSVRYFTVYGPRQRPDMAIQRFLRAALTGESIEVYGDGEQTRDFTFVADAVEAIRRAAELGAPGAVYNVGGGSTVSVNGLLKMIEQVSGQSLQVVYREAQRGDVTDTCADNSRARAMLDFAPQTALKDGLARHWGWLLERRARGSR